MAEALVEALAEVPVEGKPVLVARAAEARDVLPDALRARGAAVDVVALYETVREIAGTGGGRGRDGRRLRDVHLVVDRQELPRGDGWADARGARIVSIGPVTSAALREAGSTVDFEAERHDPDGLVEALLADVS